MLPEQYAPASRAIRNKFLRLATELEQRIQINELSTEDQFFAEVNAALWEFYTFLRIPHSDQLRIKHKDTLSPTVILSVLRAAIIDLQESYDRIGETQDEILRRNNRYASSMRDIRTRIQHANAVTASVSRLLEDDVFEISDSFIDETLLDSSTAERPLSINVDAGVLTLPLIAIEPAPIATIKILKSSNGKVVKEHPLTSLVDSNIDTWLEYRRTGELDNDPLVLEFLISLQTIQIINQIQIFPLGLDDRAFPRIIDISTSLDGRSYESIRSSISTFLSKEEEDSLFILGAVGFRNQDHSDFTFTPRTCQFVRVKIQQGKRILLDGEQTLRITLRDIRINKVEYEDKGEISSRVIPLGFSPRKLKLISRDVVTTPLTVLEYQVSFDEGAQWYDIEAGQDVEINTGVPGALDVPGKFSSIKVKILAERDRTKFNGLARPLANTFKTITSRISINGVPSEIGLENVPLEDSLLVSRPVASIGTDFGYPIQRANGESNLVIDFPIDIRPFSEIVKINGNAWDRVSSFEGAVPGDHWYTIDYANKKIQFSDARFGMLPEGEVSLQLDPEQVLLPDTSPLKINLDNAHDFNASHIQLYWYDRIRITKEETLARGAKEFQLENKPVFQSLDVQEDVPKNVSTFYLKYIPRETGVLIFSDKVKFATLVTTTPSAAGEYSITPLKTGVVSPVKITLYGNTDSNNPGTVSMEAMARIQNPKATYTQDAWLVAIGYPGLSKILNEVELYFPIFSDASVFKVEQTFFDGSSELTQAGDYSIDYTNGKIYTFSTTLDQGITHVVYNYQNRRALNWEFVPDNPKQLIINDDSFLVTKNDQFPVVIDDGNLWNVVFKDSRYVWVPVSTSGTSYRDPSGDLPTINYTTADYVAGYILPPGRTRVHLPQQSLVQNSARFLFLSNDTNAYDDRIVSYTKTINNVETVTTKNDPDAVIKIAPKPIRDAYGNALDGIGVGVRTQRDVDKLTLTRERPYINGQKELEIGGDYSLDYKNGILFSYSPIPEHTIIQYEYADVRATYVATQVLKLDDQYNLDLTNLALNITSLGGSVDLKTSELLIRYDIIEQLKEDPVKIYRHYSPILMGYQLKIKS
jgi:hypothetical protein